MYELVITETNVTLSDGKSSKTWKTANPAIVLIDNEIEKCKSSEKYKNGYAKNPVLTTQLNVMNPLYFLLLCRLHLSYGLVDYNLFGRTEARVTLGDDNKSISLRIEKNSNAPLKRDIVCVTGQQGFSIYN